MAPHAGEQENYARDFTMVEARALRKRTEAAIEALVALLDELDIDPDLEPDEDAEDGGDDEPSLGAPEVGLSGGLYYHEAARPLVRTGTPRRSQLSWSAGGYDDREDEHDGREPDDSGIADLGGLAEQCGRARFVEGGVL